MTTQSDYILTDMPEGAEYPWCDLFQTRRYFRLHLLGNNRYFVLRRRKEDKAVAAIHFSEIKPGHFRSPGRATYGGPAVNPVDRKVTEPFLQMVCKRLRAEGAAQVSLTCAPQAHEPEQTAVLWETLQTLGFEVLETIPNYTIPVDATDLVAKMAHNNRKRLHKCERAGFCFTGVTEASQRRSIYDTILANRQSRGFNLSMSWPEIETMVRNFPENVEFYAVSDGEQTAAGAICLRLNTRILYTLFWGHLPEFDSYSPVAMLAAGIYDRCRERGIRLMDLGTAAQSVAGEITGLMRFKERLGAKVSEKRTYCRKF